MEWTELLTTRSRCDCGRTHEAHVRRFLYESGSIRQLPDILHQCVEPAGVRRATVVADVRTWAICGCRAYEALSLAGIRVSDLIVPDRVTGGPVCDERTFRSLVERLRVTRPDAIVAVGSGVISDLCKWAAFELDLPYVVVATAASMNGYAAANVAPQIDGVKVLIEARPPVAVLAEPSVIEGAPYTMTAAGFGDTIAKYQSNSDWLLNHRLLGEYYCHFCAGIIGDLEPLYLDRPEDLPDGKPDAVRGLFEALFRTGLAMTFAGTSAPASGGEHLLSHTLDMTAELHAQGHDLHGRQVGVGTLLSAALYERVVAIDRPALAELPAAIDEAYWREPTVIAAVTAQYRAKQESVEIVRRRLMEGHVWDRLRIDLAAQAKSPATIHDWLRRAGAASSMHDIGCSRPRFRAALLHMHEIRKRFTIVDLAWLVGVLPDAADDLIDQWLAGPAG